MKFWEFWHENSAWVIVLALALLATVGIFASERSPCVESVRPLAGASLPCANGGRIDVRDGYVYCRCER